MGGLISVNKTQDKYVQMYASDGSNQWFFDSYTKYPYFSDPIDEEMFIVVSPRILAKW